MTNILSKKGDRKFQTGNVFIISFAHFFHDTYSSFLAPLLPLLIAKFGISYFFVSLLSVIQKLPSLSNPFVGVIADRICIKYLIIFSPFLTALCMSLLGIAPNYVVLAILLFIMGISSTLFHVPAPVLIKKAAGNNIGKGMSFYMLGGELARTIGPLVVLGAVSLWGLEGTYKLIPFSFLLSLFLYVKLKNIKNSNHFEKKLSIHKTFAKLAPFFIASSGIVFCRAAMKSALTLFLPTYLNTGGLSLWLAGIALSIVQFSGAFGTFFAGTISDKIGRKITLLIITIATPIFMWLFLVFNNIFMIPILVLLGISLFAVNPVLLALIHDSDSDRPSFINGTYMMINFVISAVTVVLVGVLIDLLGFEMAYKFSALLAFGAIPFVFMIPNHKEKSIKIVNVDDKFIE